jgi:serine/threonine protein kinase
LGRELGRGAFGIVNLALDVRSGESVAIKRTPLASSHGDVRGFTREVNFLRKLDSPFIVRYLDSYRDSVSMFLVMEYIEGGSLAELVKRHGPLPESLAAFLVAQALVGMSFLHDNGLVHRDIKANNVLITKEGAVKLCDFGLVIMDDESRREPSTAPTGSLYYWSPEVVQLGEPTAAADIWALGATVIELVTGMPPNGELGALAAAFRIVSDVKGPRLPPNASPALRAFLVDAFTRDPKSRPTAKALLESAWISNALLALSNDPRRATSRLLREVRQHRVRT